MQQSPISIKVIIFAILFSLLVTGILFIIFLRRNNTFIVFCDVGQGDGTYIRINNQIDVIVDAGPDNGMMLSCLGKYMPFFDKQIEIAILSHPQSDHYGGLKSIVDRYKIQNLYISDRENIDKSVTQVFQKIAQQKGSVSIVRAGEQLSVFTSIFHFYWPPPYLINKNGVSAIKNSDDNIFSSVLLFKENNFSVLFTGDTPSYLLGNMVKTTNVPISILKVSHHGSKNGTSQYFVSLAHPLLAVISVGEKNTYGHPAKEVLEIFKALKIPVRRTDKEGNIVIRFP